MSWRDARALATFTLVRLNEFAEVDGDFLEMARELKAAVDVLVWKADFEVYGFGGGDE